MKKFIMLAIVLTTITVSAFSNNTYRINQKVLSSFSKSFNHVEDARWETVNNLYKVTFKTAGKEMYAYYNSDGDQVALTRNISIDQLPLTLSSELREKFALSWLTDLFEISTNGETAYYAKMESATHITMLKADGASGWSTFRKDKRK